MMHRLVSFLLLATCWSGVFARVGPLPPEPPKDTPRLTKLRTLTFDRRPSAILKARSPQFPLIKDDKKPEPLDLELEAFQRQVTLGEWPAVKAYLAKLPEGERKAAYEQLLRSLATGPTPQRPTAPPELAGMEEALGLPMLPAAVAYAERNAFSLDDIVGIAASAPSKLEKAELNSLGNITRQAITNGVVVENVVARLQSETAKPDPALTKRQVARLLAGANQNTFTSAFLPDLATARKDRDIEALNLLARHYLAMHAKESRLTLLERAWDSTQAALSIPLHADTFAESEEALIRAVEIAPRLKAEMGQAWLDQSFTAKTERGLLMLATIGTLSSKGLQTQTFNPDQRHKVLKLQKTAVEALLRASPRQAQEWSDTLTLLALGWLREAKVSYRLAPDARAKMRRDRYGNIFFYDEDFFRGPRPSFNPNEPKPIGLREILESRPGMDWLDRVQPDVRPKVRIVLCQLLLKNDEEREAFPSMAALAKTHREQAHELTKEFLRVWTRTHDPNDARRYTNPYMFMFGFDRRSDGIPLTRSKQERNLQELSEWVVKLKGLNVGEVDEELLAKAFTTCHSSAEVYRSEAVEKVFGPIGGLKPKTLSSLAQQMRENLAGVWRKPEEQKDKKTNRKTRDIQAEVKRGYEVALKMVDDAIAKHPREWSLVLARAALMHDETSFDQEIKKSTSFAPQRNQALATFRKAAALYAARVAELPEDEQSTRVYEQWFYAGLGAVDLGQVTEEKQEDLRQPTLIRAAIQKLPGELATLHMERFANQLFTRMSAVKPQVKFRYLKSGFDIVGDHKEAAEARKVYDYYKDLVREIKLVTEIDGPAEVGHNRPFGVYVKLRHTRDIERESGGFGRYLQNQNTNTMFSWNYGRPTADYRDRFQTAATEALKEHYEVLSVTFETDKVHSRADREYGWRITPYAYLLLKARGPQVDKLPPLRIDLDFLDTSGYVVLPIESSLRPLDASQNAVEPRPHGKVEITQTLDERQAKEGKLIVEVKATAEGLVPELTDLVDLSPEGFEVVKTTDQGVSVARFVQDSERITVASERTWMVTLRAKGGMQPTMFRFGKSVIPEAKMVYQRYDDADMVNASEEMELAASYGKRSPLWLWLGGGVVVLLGIGALVLRKKLRREATTEVKWHAPETPTPFNVIALLERIRDEGGLDESAKAQVQAAITGVEQRYFADGAQSDGRAELSELARRWVAVAR